MVEQDAHIFIPSGMLRLHASTESASTTNMAKEEKARRTLPQNTPEYIRDNFINVDSLYEMLLPGMGIVRTIEPSKPYAYGGIMVVAAHEALVSGNEDKNDTIGTYNIYDYDPELQHEYFRQIIAGVQAQTRTTFPHDDTNRDTQAVAVENTQVKISDYQHRMARSIAIPHIHVIRVGDWIDTDTSAPSSTGLRFEQKYVGSENIFSRLKAFFHEATARNSNSEIFDSLELRTASPYGYSIPTDLRIDDPLDTQTKGIASIMNDNNKIYTDFANQQIASANRQRQARNLGKESKNLVKPRDVTDQILPQPSYRTYIYYRNGRLVVTISPAILSTTGVIEAAEVYFHRSPNNPRIYSLEELDDYRKKFADMFRQNLLK